MTRGSQVARLAFGAVAARHNEGGAALYNRYSLHFCFSRVPPKINVLNCCRNQTFPCSLQIDPAAKRNMIAWRLAWRTWLTGRDLSPNRGNAEAAVWSGNARI
jgi:hypothetical protein